VLGVEELEEGVNMVSVDGSYGVVGLAKPEEDGAGDGNSGCGGGSVV
jgi:hypothetical protein